MGRHSSVNNLKAIDLLLFKRFHVIGRSQFDEYLDLVLLYDSIRTTNYAFQLFTRLCMPYRF